FTEGAKNDCQDVASHCEGKCTQDLSCIKR
ncbi:hypothetical protein DBR06_SOUSAS7510043, partial [Sousa chinensis]